MFDVSAMCNIVHTVSQHKGAGALTADGAKSQNPAHVYHFCCYIVVEIRTYDVKEVYCFNKSHHSPRPRPRYSVMLKPTLTHSLPCTRTNHQECEWTQSPHVNSSYPLSSERHSDCSVCGIISKEALFLRPDMMGVSAEDEKKSDIAAAEVA